MQVIYSALSCLPDGNSMGPQQASQAHTIEFQSLGLNHYLVLAYRTLQQVQNLIMIW